MSATGPSYGSCSATCATVPATSSLPQPTLPSTPASACIRRASSGKAGREDTPASRSKPRLWPHQTVFTRGLTGSIAAVARATSAPVAGAARPRLASSRPSSARGPGRRSRTRPGAAPLPRRQWQPARRNRAGPVGGERGAQKRCDVFERRQIAEPSGEPDLQRRQDLGAAFRSDGVEQGGASDVVRAYARRHEWRAAPHELGHVELEGMPSFDVHRHAIGRSAGRYHGQSAVRARHHRPFGLLGGPFGSRGRRCDEHQAQHGQATLAHRRSSFRRHGGPRSRSRREPRVKTAAKPLRRTLRSRRRPALAGRAGRRGSDRRRRCRRFGCAGRRRRARHRACSGRCSGRPCR